MMNPAAMANSIRSAMNKLDDPSKALDAFYDALCDYVEANAQVYYAWVGIQPTVPTPTPDPVTTFIATIKTNGKLSLSGESDPNLACAKFSSDLNKVAVKWEVQPPEGFSLFDPNAAPGEPPVLHVIPTINITPSGATDSDSAWLAVCSQIISGLVAATPTALGSHGSFTAPPGTGATFVKLI